jgi:hypothetical protein
MELKLSYSVGEERKTDFKFCIGGWRRNMPINFCF